MEQSPTVTASYWLTYCISQTTVTHLFNQAFDGYDYNSVTFLDFVDLIMFNMDIGALKNANDDDDDDDDGDDDDDEPNHAVSFVKVQ